MMHSLQNETAKIDIKLFQIKHPHTNLKQAPCKLHTSATKSKLELQRGSDQARNSIQARLSQSPQCHMGKKEEKVGKEGAASFCRLLCNVTYTQVEVEVIPALF